VTPRTRILAAACVCALHLALFAPTVGSWSSVLDLDFGPEAEAIQGGDRPYDDQDLEYPPLSIPVIVAPALTGNGTEHYESAFEWEMVGFDVAIVCLLALALQGDQRKVLSALGVYTAGVVAVSGVVLGSSDIDTAPLALARFDLVPALLVLAAGLARERNRSATWSALLSTGAMVKAFPLALYPPWTRGEHRPWRVLIAGLVPVLVAAAIVIAWGDDFGSAISYHTGRQLQAETVAATPFEIASQFGAGATIDFSGGSWNVVASGADLARALSIAALIVGYLVVLVAGWRARTGHLQFATALLAVIVIFAPVLSPQFLFWLLPISAAAYGLGRENVILLIALVLTQLDLQFYGQLIGGLPASDFVWRLAARNVALLVYLYVVCAPILRRARYPRGSVTTS
jgi:glycosyl transferase family 87